jgi:hypothetical protein
MAGFQTGKRDYADGSSTYPFVASVATGNFLVELKAFEALVRADEREQGQKWFDAVTAQNKQLILAEREACAKVCEELVPDMSRTANDASVWDVATFDCAIAIRARGNT